ncbi:hypothetical protein MTO96_003944 [Rhipicephalus appendiculatus]
MSGEPVQILRVEDGQRIVFNERVLKDILLADHIKDRPVVVVSIAGAIPTRKLLFQMTNSKGEEVAVLLMDTQGTFDCQSTMKESTMIFSLSMMTSSVQIYNIMNNIKEDDLQHLHFFAEYGRLAQKDNKTQAFQKLLFLVRDWNWGGTNSNIDCFLMPSPGKKVVSDKSFDGRLADIEEEFRVKLLELVFSILAPENLLVKEINGRKLSCQDLMILFKAHVDVFKGGDLPNPTSMLMVSTLNNIRKFFKSTTLFQATANATNMAAVDKATKRYMSGMKNRPRRNLDRLREFHDELLAEAKKVFDEFPKMGGEAISSTSKDALIKELEDLFRHFYEEEEKLIRIETEAEAQRQEGKAGREEKGRTERKGANCGERKVGSKRKGNTERERGI